MADQQRRVSLIFDADASKAKQAINELGNSLNNIMNISSRSFNVASIDKDLRKAGQSAALLQTQLKQAMNVNTGKLDLTKFNDSLKASGMSLEKYQQTFMNIGPAGERAFSNLARSIATAEIPLRRSSTLLNSFATSLKNTVKWQLSSSLMHGFLSSIQSAMSYARNLNANLNDIRIVTGQSAEEMARFAEQANRSAKELSTTTNQYAQAALIFYQQGLGDKQVKERTDAVIKMANVTGEAAKDVSSYMTAIWNNFDDGSKSLEYYADVITKLGASTAASSAEIAGGLEKFAAVGNTIGLSYEYATAMLTTIIDKTRQSEDVVGTALKTILARIQGLNLGETLDDGTTLNKYSQALASVGVQIKDASGQVRDMNSILDDLGSKWQTLGKDTQIALAQVVGGVRQYNQIISLMDNWDSFKMNVDIALDSEGSLQKQADIYAESWEAARKRVQASAESIYSSLLDDDFFIGFNNVLAEVLDQVNNLIKGLGGVKGVVVTLGTVLMTVFNQQITASLKNFTHNLQMMTKTGQQKLIDLQQESQKLLAKIGSDKGTVGGGIIADAYVKEAQVQQQLLSVSQKLNAQEKETANTLMRQVQLRTDQQVAAGQQVSSAQQNLEIAVANVERLQASFGKGVPNILGKSLKDILADINGIGAAAPQVSALFDNAALVINNSSITTEEKIKSLKNLLSDFDNIPLSKGLVGLFGELQKTVNAAHPSVEKIKAALNNLMEPIDKAKDSINGYIAKLRELAKEEFDKGNVDKSMQYIRLADSLDKVAKNAETYGDALQKAGVAQKNSAQASAMLTEFLAKTGIQIISNQEKLLIYARTLGSLAMTINQLKGLIEVWNDDSKSLGDKLLTTLTTFSILIPTLVSTGTALKNMGISIKATTMAWKGYSVGAIKGATTTMGFGTAVATSMPYLVAISAILVSIGAAVYGIAKAVSSDPLGELNEKISETEREGRKLRTELQEIDKEIDTIYGDFNEYQIALDALNNLTVGTEAWYEQLEKISSLTDTLMSSYPILADMMAHPNKYPGIPIKDAQGYWTTEALEEAQKYTIQEQIAKAAVDTSGIITNRDEKIQLQDQLYIEEIQTRLGNGFSWLGGGANAPYTDRGLELLTPIFAAMVGSGQITESSSDFALYNPENIVAQMKKMPLYYTPGENGKEGTWTKEAVELMYGLQSSTSSRSTKAADYAAIKHNYFTGKNELRLDEESEYYEQGLRQWLYRNNAFLLNTSVGNEQWSFNNAKNWGNALVSYLFSDLVTDRRLTNEEVYNNDVDTSFDSLGAFGLQSFGISSTDLTEALSHAFGVAVKESSQPITNVEELVNNSPSRIAELLGFSSASGMHFEYDAEEDKLTYKDPYSKEEEQEPIEIANISNVLGYLEWIAEAGGQIESVADVIKLIHSNVSESKDFGLLEQYYTGTEQGDFTEEELKRLKGLGVRIDDKYLNTEFWDNEILTGKNLTYSQADQYLNLGSAQRALIDPYILEHPELLTMVQGEGYGWLKEFNQQLIDLGISLDKSSSEYRSFEAAILKGHLPIEMYDNFTSSVEELASSMIKAKKEGISSEEVTHLNDSGFDISKLSYRDGKYYGDIDPTEYFTELHKADQYADWIIADEYGNYKWNIPKDKLSDSGELALESGYNPLSTSTTEFFEKILKYKDAFGAEDAQAASQFGFQFADILEEQGYAADFMEAMAFAQAQIDDIDWETLIGFDEDGKIVSEIEYLAAKTALNLDAGILSIIDNYASFIEDDLGKLLAERSKNGELLTSAEKDTLDKLKLALANIFGVSIETITDDFIINNWANIGALTSGRETVTTDAIKEMSTELPVDKNFDASKVGKTISENIEPEVIQEALDYATKRVASGFAKGKISESSLKDLNAAGTILFGEVENATIDAYLEAAGLIKDGELTEVAELLGYETVEQLREGLIQSIKTATDEINKDPEVSGLVLSAYEAVWGSLGAADGQQQTLSNKKAIVTLLNNTFKEGGIEKLNVISDILQDAGSKAGMLATELNGIDWSSATISDLRSTLDNLGISTDVTDISLQAFIDAMNDAAEATTTATEAISKYAELMGLIEGLTGEEGKISSEDIDTLSDSGLYSYDQLREMFTANADGTYTINDKEQSNDIAWALLNQQQATLSAQAASASQLATNLSQASQYLNTGFEIGNEENVVRAYLDAARWASSDASKYQDITYKDELGNIYGFSDVVANLQSSNPEDIVKGIQMFEALGKNLGGFEEDLLNIAEQSEFEAERLGEMAINTPDEFINNQLAQATDMVSLENVSDNISSQIGQQFENTEEYSKALLKLAENYETVQDELQAYQKALEEGDEQQIESTKKALKMAMSQEDFRKEMTRSSKSIQDHIKNMKKWTKEYGDQSKKFDEYKEEVEGVQKELSKLFGKKIDSKFITDNLDDIQLAAEGDEEAFQRLQNKVKEQYGPLEIKVDDSELFAMEDSMAGLQNWINDMNLEVDVHGYADMDSLVTGIIQALMTSKSYIDQFGNDASNAIAQVQAALNSQFEGYNFTIEQTGTQIQEVGKQTSVVMGYKTGHYDQIPSDATGVPIRHFTSYRYPESVTTTPITEERPVYTTKVDKSGYSKNPYSGTSSASRPRGGGGGGGGGGSRAPQAEKKQSSDKERYHTVTNQLEDLTDAYDKVSKAADRAFGKARIKLLQDQRKELQKLAAAQQSYIDEINDYYQQDLSNLDQVSQYIGFDIQLDENGTITNFDAIQDAMWDEYNSHINDKDEVIDMDEEAWKEYEEEWERIMALIEQYEETQDLRKEALQQLQDYINEIYDLQLEEVTYSVEIDIEASDYALEILDYLLKQVEDDAWSAAEAIAYMGDQAADFLDQSQTYNSGIADILRNHTRDITDANGKVLKKATLTEADIQGYLNGDQASTDKIKELGLKGEFTDEEIQSLKDYHSQLLEINQSLIDLREQVYDTLSDSFSKFNEELQDTIDIMEHLTNITDSYRNIIDLVGKKNVGISNALLESFSQIQTNQAIDLVKAQKSRLDDLTAMRDEAEALRQKMLAEGNEKDAKEIEERIKEMNKQIREATEDYTGALEDALQRAEDQFKLHISNIIEDANQAFAGAMVNIQQLQDMFNLKNDTNNIYLEDFEKIYELNKLNRDITNSIDETSNIKAKEELAKLQAEINALEEDGVKVSQYQTEDLRRRYELKLAEIALNEAKDAKSQVQMTRDADGNWSYIYTADENQVAEAEQNYEDRLYELQRANADYINEMQDLLIQTEAELMAKIEEITNDQTLSLEEKQALIDEFTAQYTEKFNGYAGELKLVLDNNKLLYEDEWTAYSNLTGYKISADENYVDSFNETMLSTLTGFQTAEEFHQNFNDTTEMLLNESNIAFEEWENNVDEVFDAAGLSSEDLAETLEDQFNNISNDSEDLVEDIEDTGDSAVETFGDIVDAVDNWYEQYSATIDRVLEQNTALAKSFRELLSAWSDYQESSEVDDSGDDTGDEPPADEETPVDEETEPEVLDPVEKANKYKKGIAFAIWHYPGGAGWGNGQTRRQRMAEKGMDYKTVQAQINRYEGKKAKAMASDSGLSGTEESLRPYIYKEFAFDTGGYTGSWGREGRWALLHEKEIVLNKEDTSNLLSAINMIRQISEAIDLNAYSSAGFGKGIGAAASVGSAGTLEQVVHVTAEFPNATNKDEIYAAFGEIINLASQYANRR